MIININQHTVEYHLSKDNLQIIDSYKIHSRVDMSAILTALRAEAQKQGYVYHRSDASWIREWRAHNFLYEANIQRARTKDVDLNENEALWRRAAYWILSILYD
jgi:hypothetical protein